MNILHYNQSDIVGGAAVAACRIHRAQLAEGIYTRMLVDRKSSGLSTVFSLNQSLKPFISPLKSQFSSRITRLISPSLTGLHSLGIFRSSIRNVINKSNFDLVNLHWTQAECLSVSDIAKIRKPIVWTLHDMWAFCGAEHYCDHTRWEEGYSVNNRPFNERGVDINLWNWRRKQRLWKNKFNIVTPSNWLADCARRSKLFQNSNIFVIPNCIDIKYWRPIDKKTARQIIGLPVDVPLLLFAATGGTVDPRKGFDLLVASLKNLSKNISGLELVVLGQSTPKESIDFGYPVHYMGHFFDEASLKCLYSAADVMVIPSRQDNLPNTGLESLACGTPLVSFNICGMSDLIDHKKNGYLARKFDCVDLAKGIEFIFENLSKNEMNINCLNKVASTFSFEIISKQYIDLYKSVLSDQLF